MDPVTIGVLLEAGLEIAESVLEAHKVDQQAAALHTSLERLVADSSKRLGAAIQEVGAQVVDKIESDKLEELHSRTKNLSFLLKTGKPDQVLQYAMTLNESVDYAFNRIKEGKVHWTGPWLAGQGIVLAGLEVCGASGDLRELRENAQRVRYQMVDILVRAMIDAQVEPLPWPEVHDFLDGKSGHLVATTRSMLGSAAGSKPDVSRHRAIRVPRPPAEREAFCISCSQFYPTTDSRCCPKCGRNTGDNLTLLNAGYCSECDKTWNLRYSSSCARCKGPIQRLW